MYFFGGLKGMRISDVVGMGCFVCVSFVFFVAGV